MLSQASKVRWGGLWHEHACKDCSHLFPKYSSHVNVQMHVHPFAKYCMVSLEPYNINTLTPHFQSWVGPVSSLPFCHSPPLPPSSLFLSHQAMVQRGLEQGATHQSRCMCSAFKWESRGRRTERRDSRRGKGEMERAVARQSARTYNMTDFVTYSS